jgi:hypothetical protein
MAFISPPKPSFSARTLLARRGLVAEAVDFLTCHLGCLTPAFFAELTRGSRAASKTELRELSDRLCLRRKIALFAAPLIYGLQK